MREVAVIIWCDHHGRGTPGEVTRSLAVDGPARELDLCAECAARPWRLDDLADLLKRRGRLPDTPPPSSPASETTCPECGKTGFSSRHTRNSHLRDRHHKSVRDYPGLAQRGGRPSTTPTPPATPDIQDHAA